MMTGTLKMLYPSEGVVPDLHFWEMLVFLCVVPLICRCFETVTQLVVIFF